MQERFIHSVAHGTADTYAKQLIGSINAHFRRLYPQTFDDLQRIPVVVSQSTMQLMTDVRTLDEIQIQRGLYGHEPFAHTTPRGFHYQEVATASELEPQNIPVGYFGPHPSDFADFLGATILQMHHVRAYEFLVTAGEKGVASLSPKKTAQIRQQETAVASNMLSITSINLPHLLPDGEVMHHMQSLILQIKQQIREYNLQIIFAPAPEVDHPDHVAVHVAVLHALQQLKEEGYFHERELPALYITDPEYGYNSGGEWAFQEVNRFMPEVYPASSQFLRRGQIDQTNFDPMVVPTFIIFANDEIMAQALEALYVHKTQMWEQDGNEKPYRRKIPAFKRLRGLQVNKNWGEGLRQYIIPGITTEENILLNHLPNHSMFTLTR